VIGKKEQRGDALLVHGLSCGSISQSWAKKLLTAIFRRKVEGQSPNDVIL